MEIVINQKELDKALQAVSRMANGKLSLQVLTGVLITAEAGNIVLSANNYETAIQYVVDAEVLTPGKALVSGRLFSDLVKKMPTGDIIIKFEKESNTLKVHGKGNTYNILTMKAVDFPGIEKISGQGSVELLAGELRDAFRYTSFAAAEAKGGVKEVYTGIHFLFSNEKIDVASTDTHRMARKQLPFSGSGEQNIIIPEKSLSDVIALFDPEDMVKIEWTSNRVAFSTPHIYVLSQILNGKSPDFERVIPKAINTEIKASRAELLAALERLSLISMQRMKDFFLNDVVLIANASVGSFKISGRSSDRGVAQEEVRADISGEHIEICFNGSNITECLKILNADIVTLSFNTARHPAMVTCDNDPSFVYVFTPVLRQQAEAVG